MSTGFTLMKTVMLAGLALWLSVAVFNNITDFATNDHLLGIMLSMQLVKGDEALGNGLEWRAWSEQAATGVLCAVIVVQVAVSALLWRGAALFLRAARIGDAAAELRAIRAANQGVAAFMGLWFWFMIGGLWFGYWMKQGPVQMVHMTLLILAFLSAIAVNHRPDRTT
ncbi:MAG: DUF2165 family protein [Azospirillaceae bacterium]